MWKRVLLSLVLIVAICGCELGVGNGWLGAFAKLAGEGIAEGMGYAATAPISTLITTPIANALNGIAAAVQ